MADFRGYLCWETDKVLETVSTEAVSPSSDVFLATHAPLHIRRRSATAVEASDAGEVVDENAVLRDFTTHATNQGVLIMPVIGDSGTGKSHLVRWIREQIPPSDKRRVIYLPKTKTSLVAVVDELLAGVEGEQFAQLREDVRRLDREVDQAGLEQRLLNQLAEALVALEAATDAPGEARPLLGRFGLATLLLDPHFREHLLRPGSLIPSLAQSLLADRSEEATERQLAFTVEDLPLDIADLTKAADVSQKLLRIMLARPGLQVRAVELLNQQLDIAVMNAANLGVGRLQRAFLQIREEFARQGREIILLIEDFALIQGVQRDLLAAIIETGVREGVEVLAPIRTLLAVTSGYYRRLADTVLSRATAGVPYVYDLDAQFGDLSKDDLASFVGRYLNAARLGRSRLESLGVRDISEVPNACDTCPMREPCHLGFGASNDGFGLYPFNRSALLRAAHSRAPELTPRAFNPRSVLGQVVRNVLVEHADTIRDGAFPSPRFRQDYTTAELDRPLPVSVGAVLSEVDPADAERRMLTLEFWGDAPTEAGNLAPQLHEAFSLPVLPDLAGYTPRITDTAQSVASDPAGPTSVTPVLAGKLGAIEDWASRNHDLRQNVAAEIRAILREAVISRTRWCDPLRPDPKSDALERVWPKKGGKFVWIEGAFGQRTQDGGDAALRFTRSPANAAFFQGLLRAQAGSLSGNGAHVRRLADIAERHAKHVEAGLTQIQQVDDDAVVLGLRASLIGAALAGRVTPTSPEEDLMNAAFDDGQGWQRTDRDLLVDGWTRLLDRHLAGRSELVGALRAAFGISQGVSGRVRMLDAARVRPQMRVAAKVWVWTTPPTGVPDWLRKSVANFADLEQIAQSQVDALEDRLFSVRSLLGSGEGYTELLDSVERSLDAAVEVGLAPSDVNAVRTALTAARSIDAKCVDSLERDLEKLRSRGVDEATLGSLLAATAPDRGPGLGELQAWLRATDVWLSQGLQQAALRTNPSGDNAVAILTQLLGEWEAAAKAVLDV